MKISLKVRLMITFFILIAIPMTILGAISYKMASSSLQSSIDERLMQQASDTADLIEKSIHSVEDVVKISSLNNQLANIAIAQNRNEGDIDTAFTYINDVQQSNDDFMEVLIVTDANGRVIIDTQTKEPDIDLGDRDYMREAISSGKVTVSDVVVSRFTGNPAIFVACPIKHNGEVIGTVVGSIKFDSISNYVSSIKIGEKGYGYMLEPNGLIVEHPDESKVLNENVTENSDIKMDEIYNKVKNGETVKEFYSYENMRKCAAFKAVDKWIVVITAEYNEYMKAAIDIRNDTIVIVLISVIIAMICSYVYSTKGIINPIRDLQRLMKAAGNGDLRVKSEIKKQNEIGDLGVSFNNMIKNQKEIVNKVIDSSESLNQASEQSASSLEELNAVTEEMSATINNIAEESESQNRAIVDISGVLVQLSSLVQLAQNRAQATSVNAETSKKVADLGRKKVEETVQAMNCISFESNETFNVLKRVNELSIKVGGIVTTINSVAEQTNLLALNAAIEAARAGEHGKGFSIVAEEVRKLSEETNTKAKEITSIVSEMMHQTKNAVSAMERSNSEVENGVTIVSETDKAFLDIISSIESIVKHINEILDITSDEVASSDKVVSLINEVATITENNNNNCQEVSLAAQDEAESINNLTAVAEETTIMSEELVKLVEKFVL